MKKVLMIAASAAFVLGISGLTATDSNAKAWSKCKACHNFTAKKKVGPGLAGVFGRKAGTFPGFKYKYMKYVKGDAWSWDEAHLRKWMCNSKKAVKEFTGDKKARTKMPPQKICDPAKQDEVIAKLKSVS
ncbi:MAG: cytochrome C [Mariprofundaceae bacterium]|nr:cytochrome C [Mariprofundaceae bacterium]